MFYVLQISTKLSSPSLSFHEILCFLLERLCFLFEFILSLLEILCFLLENLCFLFCPNSYVREKICYFFAKNMVLCFA